MMKGFTRAMIYVRRQRVRSLILFAIFLIMLLITLLGFSIMNATQRVQEQIRRSVPGFITVTSDTKNHGPSVDENTLMEARILDGVVQVNANGTERMVFPDLILLDKAGETMAIAKNMTMVYGCTDLEKQVWFLDGTFTLARGQMPDSETARGCMISDVVAFESGLNVGDTVTGYWRDSAETYDQSSPVSWTIVGVYRVQDEYAQMQDPDYLEAPANTVFIDELSFEQLYAADPDHPNHEVTYSKGIQIFALEQSELGQLETRLSEKFPDHIVQLYDDSFEQLTYPLLQMQRLLRVLMTVVIVIMGIILLLVTALWVRNRGHEMGIYLSIGCRKKDIILQLLTEILVIALIAVLIVWPLSALISGQIGRSLYQTVSRQSTSPAAMEDFKVNVSMMSFSLTVLVAIVLSFAATVVSSIQVLVLQPRKILTMLS